jgi:hypothetical protein
MTKRKVKKKAEDERKINKEERVERETMKGCKK